MLFISIFQDGSAGYTLPSPHQYFQQRQVGSNKISDSAPSNLDKKILSVRGNANFNIETPLYKLQCHES
jgi:hypothetical protein